MFSIMEEWVSTIPPGVHVLFISRNEPLQEMTRLFTNKKAGYLGWNDLQFTVKEAGDLMKSQTGKKPKPVLLQKIHERTAGWAAGLVLLGERADFGTAMGGLDGAGPNASTFDYFSQEVFRHVEPGVRKFLILSSLLPEMTPAATSRFTGAPDAEQLLSQLNRNHFFTTRHRRQGISYQYHPLFREFLLAQAEQAFSSSELRDLRMRAATVLEESRQDDLAIELCIAAEGWAEAARLICTRAPALFSQGRNSVVLAWLDALPRNFVESIPWLLFWRGACFFVFDPKESRRYFERAFSGFRRQGDRTGLFLAWCGVVDTSLHENTYRHLQPWLAVLQEILSEDPSFPSRDIEIRIQLSLFNAVAFGAPDHPDIRTLRERAFTLFSTEPINDFNLYLSTGLHLGIHLYWQGDYGRAAHILDLLLHSPAVRAAQGIVRVTMLVMEAHYALFTADLDRCMEKAEEALAAAEESGVHVWDAHTIGHAIAANLAKGDLARAEQLFAKMSPLLGTSRQVDQAYYHWLVSWKLALQEDFPAAYRSVKLAYDIVLDVGFLAPTVAGMINMADIAVERGDRTTAEAHLEQARPFVQAIQSALLSYCYFIVEAQAAYRFGDGQKGTALLRRAFAIGREHQIENFYFWRPALMSSLCAKALDKGIEMDYARQLILKRKLTPPQNHPAPADWPFPVRIFTLGEFTILRDGKPLLFSGKTPRKPVDLLKAIIASGGEQVTEEQLLDDLWPDAEGDAAHASFDTTLHRLRKLLGNDKALALNGGRLSLDPQVVWFDATAFRRKTDELEVLLQGNRTPQAAPAAAGLGEEIERLYRGDFLAGEDGSLSIVSVREELRQMYLKAMERLGRLHLEQRAWERAIEYFEKGLKADRLAEEYYQGLMLCYQGMGLENSAVRTYERCCAALEKGLGLGPSTMTEQLYAAIAKKRNS